MLSKTNLLMFIIISNWCISLSESFEECNKTYIPPGNMKFPYGDEDQMDADITLNDTNMIVCKDREQVVPEYSHCPFPPPDPDDMKLTNPYIVCPQFHDLPSFQDMPPGTQLSSVETLCKSCDVQLTPNGSAVNLKCVGCFDLPNLERTASCSEYDLVYTVYYLEVSNYTSVNVQGRENINTGQK